MAFVKKTWTDRLSEYATRRILTDQDTGTVSVVEVARSEGTIYQTGDAFSAANMNDLEDRVEDAFTGLLTGTITAGNTSVTISDASITTSSIIDIYFENKVLAPTDVTVTTGSITIEIAAQDSNVNVGVRIL